MKTRTRILLISAGLLFLLLWGGRFAVILADRPGPIPITYPQMDESTAMVQQSVDYQPSFRSKSNYASAKVIMTQAATSQVIEQKYERVASLSAQSSAFDSDLVRIRTEIEAVKGVIQGEQSTGLEGSRRVELTVGVVPELFEQAVEAFKAVGALKSVSVTKTDRTADFQALEAKRISLEKTRDGLKALKTPNAPLSDLMDLETKILEIEGQIQELGVSLGDFEETKSLCTIHLSLYERPAEAPLPNIAAALLDSLEWAVWVYAGLLATAAALLAFILLAGILAQKLLTWKQTLEQLAAAKKDKSEGA